MIAAGFFEVATASRVSPLILGLSSGSFCEVKKVCLKVHKGFKLSSVMRPALYMLYWSISSQTELSDVFWLEPPSVHSKLGAFKFKRLIEAISYTCWRI